MNKSNKYYEIRGYLNCLANQLNDFDKKYMLKEIIPFLTLLSLDAKYHEEVQK